MTMTTKAKSEPVVADLRGLRAALDAPARARVEAEAREQEAELQTRKAGLLLYARGIVRDLQDAVGASAAWTATPVNMQDLVRTFGADTPILRAHDSVNGGSVPVEAAARAVGAVDALVKELERPTVLSAPRLVAIRSALDRAAGLAESFDGVYAAWTRVRADAVELFPPLLKLIYDLRRRWTPSEAEIALLAQYQKRLADAAAAMPPIAPLAPRRRVGGADFDVERPAPSTRRPLLQNMEGL